MIFIQCNRLYPEFASHVISLNMNMHGLITVKTVEKETIWARNSFNRRH